MITRKESDIKRAIEAPGRARDTIAGAVSRKRAVVWLHGICGNEHR